MEVWRNVIMDVWGMEVWENGIPKVCGKWCGNGNYGGIELRKYVGMELWKYV